jgi:pSer/pThr/pTyr-binding forkhead associated (FHA) protein
VESSHSFPLAVKSTTIGRSAADVVFPDDQFMSPTHVRIERTGDEFTIVDTDSLNGVYLRIRDSSVVYPDDQFMVGHQVLRVCNVDHDQRRESQSGGVFVFGTPLNHAWGQLVLVGRGGVEGDRYFLRDQTVTLGREEGDIVFPTDPFVSRRHARLRLSLSDKKMEVKLEDLESANGTFLRIRARAKIVAGDTLRIGDQILRLRVVS